MKMQRSRNLVTHAYLAFIKFDQIAFWRLEDFFWGGSRIYKGGGGGSKRPTKAGVPRGVRGEAPPENIEILLLRNAFSSILGSKPKGFHYWNLSKLLCRNEKKN